MAPRRRERGSRVTPKDNEGIELLLNRLAKTNSNAEFLASLTKAGAVEG